MKTVNGDLLKLAIEGKFDVIIHGCNCFNCMGGGIAYAVRKQFPEAYKADQLTKIGDENKLGTYTKAVVERNGHKFTIVNAYTQYDVTKEINVDYDAVKKVFEEIKNDFTGQRIGYPAIGAGLAGGDWNILSKIIDTALAGEDHTFVKFV